MTDQSAGYKKKLIEVALPLDAINAASVREKSIRHGHPSTLHLWWSRKPLATARAVIWASLVDDPSVHPEEFPTEEEQQAERERLFAILEELVVWENSNNEEVLQRAKAEIRKSMGDDPIHFLDPFAGGGSLPLEARRLGLIAHARDLNPVAVMINKAMIELPAQFDGRPPVNPESRAKLDADRKWTGPEGLAADIEYYGNWMREEAFRRIGHLYPLVKLKDGTEIPAIAWLWDRTARCPNPACACEIPLASTFDISRKKGNEHSVVPVYESCELRFEVRPELSSIPGTVARRGAVCPRCGTAISFEYLRAESRAGRMNGTLVSVVGETPGRRTYVAADNTQVSAPAQATAADYPVTPLPEKALGFRVQNYGMTRHYQLFTERQLVLLTTLSDLVVEAARKIAADASVAGAPNPDEYGRAVATYLAFVVDRLTDYHSSLCSWHVPGEKISHTFTRQALPMTWNYAEANPFSSSSGSFHNMLQWVVQAASSLPSGERGVAAFGSEARQEAAQQEAEFRGAVISADPPYYDNIGYADLSDYFYIWLRRSLRTLFPDVFRTVLTPKDEELVATPFRFAGEDEARRFFEDGMLKACQAMYEEVRDDVPLTVYYAYKQKGDSDRGWETMLSAVTRAGFQITGTWPIRTEMSSRQVAQDANALASSVVLVCRKRSPEARKGTRREFVARLHRELPQTLSTLLASNIAPVDMAQSAIGPGMAIFSEYSEVLEADGTPVSVGDALRLINQELDEYLSDQQGVLDAASAFCVDLYTQNAFGPAKYGEADVLARAKNVSIDALAAADLVEASKGKVRLQNREQLVDTQGSSLWLLTQRLTQAMQEGGVAAAAAVAAQSPAAAEKAKDLAYRLYSIAEKRKWQSETLAYNALVSSWTHVMDKAALAAQERGSEQLSML